VIAGAWSDRDRRRLWMKSALWITAVDEGSLP